MLCSAEVHHAPRAINPVEAIACQCGAVWQYLEHDGSIGKVALTSGQRDKLVLLAKRTRRPFYDVLEAFVERAAMREFEGSMKRREAEASALLDVSGMLRGAR